MMIRAIIFDLGGVLLRTADFSPRDQLAERLGMQRSELEELVFGGVSGERAQRGEITVSEHWKNLRQMLNFSEQDLISMLEEFFVYDRLDDELLAYIRMLHRNYKTALLSNAWDDLRQTLHKRWNIDGLFDELIISAEVKMVKPDPRIYYLALELLKVQPAEAIFVDDMKENIKAAEQVGLKAIQYFNTPQAIHEIKGYLPEG